MDYRTKIDFSYNRQIKQYPETFSVLSGGTSFGLPFSALTTGPDLLTTGYTITINGVVSTFSGTTGATTYTWYDNSMEIAASTLSALTPSNSGTSQFTGVIFTSNTTTTIDDNPVTLTYSGISFDIIPISMISLGGGIYSGTVYTDVLQFYSAGTLDFTGRTIWVDVSGITRTERLILTNIGTGPGVVDLGIDANGFVVNQASDENLKENINTIDNALSKVLSLRGVTYNWKDRQKGGDSLKIGFVAQEVNNVIPELTYSSNGSMGVHYKDIPALLVEAIKELAGGKIVIENKKINTQTVVAEDNNIELNFNGDSKTAVGGGIHVINAINNKESAKLITDENGCWVTNTTFKPKALVIPIMTPKSSNDEYGVDGEIVGDNNFIYFKINNKWKRIELNEF